MVRWVKYGLGLIALKIAGADGSEIDIVALCAVAGLPA